MLTKRLLPLLLLLAGLNAIARGQAVRFAFLTDLHVSPGLESEANLEEIVRDINQQAFDFVVITGDITNTGSNAELQSVHRILGKLQPAYHILPGNHETNWSESAGNTYLQLWKADRFSFSFKDYFFVGFNTGPYLKMGDGHVKQEDLVWLRQELNNKKPANAKLISLAHYPLGDGLDNWYEVTGILKEHQALLALCGHGHRLSVHNFDGITGIMGRSSLPKGTYGVGYNIVSLWGDSVLIEEKLVKQEKPRVFYRSALNATSIANIKVNGKLPDYSINKAYQAHQPDFVFQDSSSILSAPVIAGKNRIAIGNSTGKLTVINTRRKKELWSVNLEGTLYASPAYSNERIVIGTTTGALSCFEASNGRKCWTTAIKAPIIGEAVIEQDRIFIGAGSGSFYCIDLNSGKVIWENKDFTGQLQARPAISNDAIIVGAWDTFLHCIDKATGTTRWKWNNGNSQKLYSPGNVVPAIYRDKVFIVAPDRYMTAIDIRTGQTVWRNNQYKVRESMGQSRDGQTIYAKLMNDSIIAVPALDSNFHIKWATNAGFGYEHNPCPIQSYNGYIYAGTKNGELIVLHEAGGELAWKYKVGNAAINGIVQDRNKRTWVTTTEGKLIRF